MSSSSSFSSESSESSSDSPHTTTTFPSAALALAAGRMRRHRRDAISPQAESEWDAPPFSTGWSWSGNPVAPTATTTTLTTSTPPTVTGDQLICPLASLPSSSSFSPFTFDTSPPDQADNGDGDGDGDPELQATLARFAFPSPTRKHRRSGESIDHHSTPPSAVSGGATRHCGTGPVKRARCGHCKHA